MAIDENLMGLANDALILSNLQLALMLHQGGEPPFFLFFGDGAGHARRRGIRARGIFERIDAVILGYVQQTEGLLEVGFGLAGKSHNDVGGDADRPPRGANPGKLLEILIAGVGAPHRLQDRIGASLDRKMDVVTDRGNFVDSLNDLAMKIIGM